jgi:hypothetical protein
MVQVVQDLVPLNMWSEVRFLVHAYMEKIRLEGENPPYVSHMFPDGD